MWYNGHMLNQITVAFVWDEELKLYSAFVPNIAAYGEGATKEEALESLKKAILMYIDEVGRDQFLAELNPPYEYESFELSNLV